MRARARFGRYFFVVMLSYMIAGFLILLNQPSIYLLLLALLIIGLGAGSLLPYIIYSATSSVESACAVSVMGIIATAASLGQFITPLIWDGLAFMFGDTSSHFIFQLVTVSCGVVLLFMLFWHAHSYRKNKQQSAL